MLKKWRLAFNLETKYFSLRHIWVMLPGLPLYLWNEGALTTIGNNLGSFIMVDKNNLEVSSRKVAKVLVEMDVHLGLSATMEVEWHGLCYQQRIDYLGLPFRCSYCRSTSHMRRDCKGFREEEKHLEKQGFPYSTLNSSMDTDFYGFEGSRDDRIDKSFLEPAKTTISKLQLYCPTFFNSLSVLERQIVSSSIWLKNSISKSASSPLMDFEVPQNSALPSRDNSTLPSPPLVTSPLEPVSPSGVLVSKKDPNPIGNSSPEPSLSLETYNNQEYNHHLSANQPLPSGYREPKEDVSNLFFVLDSFIPFLLLEK
jgi:hypothetical protein